MSTVLVFNPVADLGAVQTGDDEITLTWSQVDRILTFINGDAELGNTNGWTHTVGFIQAAVFGQFGSVVPPQGDYIFTGTTSGSASTKSHQRFSPLTYGLTIDQIDNDGVHIVVDWWGGTFVATNPDQPALNVMFYDGAGGLISTYNSGFKSPSTLYPVPVPPGGSKRMKLDQYQETVLIPANTRFIEIELQGKRNQGTFDDSSWDDVRYTLEDAETLPFVPGYAIYQNNVLVGTASANDSEFIVSGLTPGVYTYKVVVSDGTNFLSGDSNETDVTLEEPPDPAQQRRFDIIAFDDEEIYGGYLGGKLRGKVVACPGRNASIAKTCC